MIILGADLSYQSTGLVWIDSPKDTFPNNPLLGVSSKRLTFPPGKKRMLKALDRLKVAIDPRPDLCVIEDVSYGSPSRVTTMKLYGLQVLMELVLDSMDVERLIVSPMLVRKWLCGKGNVTKDIVAQELRARYGISFDNDRGYDLSDAATLACWGLEQRRFTHGG